MRLIRGAWVGVIVIGAALSFSTCDSFSLRDIYTPPETDQLLISPESIVLPIGEQFTFSAEGGLAPYVFAVTAGEGTIEPETGLYSAPSIPEPSIVSVTDSAGVQAFARVSVVASGGVLTISPATIGLAVNQSVTFAASGGVPPYSFALSSGGGSLVGAEYTAPGSSTTAVIELSDSNVPPSTRSATVTVSAPEPLGISPSSITLAAGGSITFTGDGGIEPYFFSMSGDGSLVGSTYTAAGVAGSATVTITDSDTPPASANASVTVVEAGGTLSISPPAVTMFTNSSITFSASGGTGSYNFSVPPGDGSIDSGTGEFTAPAAAGISVVTVDDGVSTADATVTVIEPITISPTAVAVPVDGTVNFSASGGTGGYTYAVTAGNGAVGSSSGDYTAPGTPGSATVTVTDSAGNAANGAITITAPQPLSITPSLVTIRTLDTVLFVASGGAGGYTYSKFSGSGSVDPATGIYTAGASPGSAVIRVTDGASNTSDANITVVAEGTLEIAPSVVTVPVFANTTFSASGGLPPYVYSVQSGVGSINSVTGVYAAPGAPGSAVVRVSDSNNDASLAAVTVAGAGCGQTFTENEDNDDNSPPWTNVDRANGLTFVPGCTVTITGTTDLDRDSDVFEFNPGNATFISVLVTWNSGSNSIDMRIDNAAGQMEVKADSTVDDNEVFFWNVDPTPGFKYLEIEAREAGVDYTITLTGN